MPARAEDLPSTIDRARCVTPAFSVHTPQSTMIVKTSSAGQAHDPVHLRHNSMGMALHDRAHALMGRVFCRVFSDTIPGRYL
jgi:hypothetical protein